MAHQENQVRLRQARVVWTSGVSVEVCPECRIPTICRSLAHFNSAVITAICPHLAWHLDRSLTPSIQTLSSTHTTMPATTAKAVVTQALQPHFCPFKASSLILDHPIQLPPHINLVPCISDPFLRTYYRPNSPGGAKSAPLPPAAAKKGVGTCWEAALRTRTLPPGAALAARGGVEPTRGSNAPAST